MPVEWMRETRAWNSAGTSACRHRSVSRIKLSLVRRSWWNLITNLLACSRRQGILQKGAFKVLSSESFKFFERIPNSFMHTFLAIYVYIPAFWKLIEEQHFVFQTPDDSGHKNFQQACWEHKLVKGMLSLPTNQLLDLWMSYLHCHLCCHSLHCWGAFELKMMLNLCMIKIYRVSLNTWRC